jgi:hypothetical protein
MPASYVGFCNDFFGTKTYMPSSKTNPDGGMPGAHGLVKDMRDFILSSMAPRLLQFDERNSLVKQVSAVQWQSDQFFTEHNKYVAEIIRHLAGLWARLESLESQGVMPAEREVLWSYAFGFIMEQMVDGFAAAKTCSTSGRGLMSMDLSALQRGVRGIHPLSRKTPPHCRTKKYAADYIQGYYYETEEALFAWMQPRLHIYKANHMVALARHCIYGQKLKKRQLKAVVDQVEGFYKR